MLKDYERPTLKNSMKDKLYANKSVFQTGLLSNNLKRENAKKC